MKKTILYIKIPKEMGLNETELIDKILSSSKTKFISIKNEKGALRIEFYTNDYMKKNVVHSIRNILIQYSKKRDENLIQYSINEITQLSGSTIPIDPLIELIKLNGFSAYKFKSGVETNAPPEVLSNISTKMAMKYKEISKLKTLTKSARSLLAALSYMFPEKSVTKLLRELLDKGFLMENEGKIRVSQDWRKLLCKLYLTSQASNKSPKVCDGIWRSK